MKNKCYKRSKLKKTLAQKREQGIPFLIWSNVSRNKEQTIEDIGYRIEPYEYSIKTRTFRNVQSLNSKLLKELHDMKINGKDRIVKRLNQKERELLDRYNIEYHEVSKKIYLR